MSKLNVAKLAIQAGHIAIDVHAVAQEPAVQKSWLQAGKDVTQAGRSVGAAMKESVNAYQRIRGYRRFDDGGMAPAPA